jgi:hypothetical protein
LAHFAFWLFLVFGLDPSRHSLACLPKIPLVSDLASGFWLLASNLLGFLRGLLVTGFSLAWFAGAFATDTENLVPVGFHGETMHIRDFRLDPLNRPTRKLYDEPTMSTNDVVVVIVFISVLETSQSVLELDGLGQSGITEKFQRPVDRRSPYLRIGPLYELVEIIDRQMAFGLEKEPEDDFALPGMLEVVLGKITLEDFVLFSRTGPFPASHFEPSPSPNFSQYMYFLRHRFL